MLRRNFCKMNGHTSCPEEYGPMWKIKIILLILRNREGNSWVSGYKSRPFLGIVIFPLSTEQGDTEETGRSVAVVLLHYHPPVPCPGGAPGVGRKMNPGPCSKRMRSLWSPCKFPDRLCTFSFRDCPWLCPTGYAYKACLSPLFCYIFVI